MNFIAFLNPDSAINDAVPLKYSIYYFLLSVLEVNEAKKTLTSKYGLKELHEKFTYYDFEQINEAVRDLVSEDLIMLSKTGVITLGITDKGVHKLLGAKVDSTLEDFKRQLYESAENFVDQANGMPLVTARENLRELDQLMAEPFANWGKDEFVSLFNVSYVSLYQQPFRPMTGKERGQLNSLIRTYQVSSLFKMIVHYVFNSEKYGRNLSFGLFLYHKDKIYSLVTEKSAAAVKVSSLRNKSKNDEKESFI